VTVKAVIFDLDGTIVTFNLDYKEMRAEVRGYLIRMGVPASVLSTNENIFEMLKKTKLFLTNTGRTEESAKKIRVEALSIAEKYELEAAAKTSLLPGAVETLKVLKKMGLKMALCTINSQKSTEQILTRFKIAEYFDAIIPREKVNQVKPNSEHCSFALKALGVAAIETVVVGDSVNDVLAAREVKAMAVGLTTGVSNQEQLKRQGANFIITSITDLPLLVEQLNKPPQRP
jgi:HAD superfamily hydrolase (TIGR01549 family)